MSPCIVNTVIVAVGVPGWGCKSRSGYKFRLTEMPGLHLWQNLWEDCFVVATYPVNSASLTISSLP